MKRIKMILTAVTIFGVVGGALAFKAHPTSVAFCGRLVANGTGVCSLVQGNSSISGTQYYTNNSVIHPTTATCAAVTCTTNIQKFLGE
jgi:hypothetical protein